MESQVVSGAIFYIYLPARSVPIDTGTASAGNGDDPEIKAVVSSGYSQDPVVTEFQRYGFSGVIEKPYKFEEMKDLLSRIMSE